MPFLENDIKNICELYTLGTSSIKIAQLLNRKWIKNLEFQKMFDSLDRRRANNYNKNIRTLYV
jgi:hypothetical protein